MGLLRGLHPGDAAGPGLNPLAREIEKPVVSDQFSEISTEKN
jgi:hypothetical protein